MSLKGSGTKSISLRLITQISLSCVFVVSLALLFGCGDDNGTGGSNPGGSPGGGGNTPGTTANEFLFALTTDTGGANSTLSGFKIDSSGALTPTEAPQQFASPSSSAIPQAAVHSSGRFLFVSSGDSIVTYRIGQNGTLTRSSSVAAPSLGFTILPEPSGHFLYASQSAGLSGAIVTYSIDPNTGVLTQVGVPEPHSLSAVLMDPQGRFLFVMDIGSIQALRINTTTGVLTPAAITTGLNNDFAQITPDGKFLFTGPTFPRGNGFAWTGFSIDPTSGALTSNGQETSFDDGGTAFDPQSRFVFVNTTAGIRVFTINSATGGLTEIAGSPFSRGTVAGSSTNGLAQLALDSTGKFLFITDGEKIGTFTIGTDGALTPISAAPVPLTGVPTTAISLFTVKSNL